MSDQREAGHGDEDAQANDMSRARFVVEAHLYLPVADKRKNETWTEMAERLYGIEIARLTGNPYREKGYLPPRSEGALSSSQEQTEPRQSRLRTVVYAYLSAPVTRRAQIAEKLGLPNGELNLGDPIAVMAAVRDRGLIDQLAELLSVAEQVSSPSPPTPTVTVEIHEAELREVAEEAWEASMRSGPEFDDWWDARQAEHEADKNEAREQ